MKRINIFLFFFLSFILGFSQTADDTITKGDWVVINSIGFTTLETESSFKVNATVFEGVIGKEFVLNSKVNLITGIELLRVKADFSNSANQQLYLNNYYLNIPVSVRLYYLKEQKVSLYASIGIYGSYLYKSKVENITDNIEDTEKGLGTNFGLQASIGGKLKVSEKLNFRLGLKSKTDVLVQSKSSVQEFELSDYYVFQIGLGLKL